MREETFMATAHFVMLYSSLIVHQSSRLLVVLFLLQVFTKLGKGTSTVRDGVLDILVHLGVGSVESIGQEDWVPAKVGRSTGLDNRSVGTAFEQDGLSARSLGESESTQSKRRAVLESVQHLVQSCMANTLQEPFAKGKFKMSESFSIQRVESGIPYEGVAVINSYM